MAKQRFAYKTILLILAGVLAGTIAVLFLLVAMVQWGVFGALPSEEALRTIRSHEASRVYSADGALLGMYFDQDRSNVAYADIPHDAVQALIANEDARFMEHDGVDYHALARVFVKTLLLSDASSGGGSTISQQLAKNLYGRTKSYGRLSMPINKLREMIIAARLETIYSKEEILALYLNTVSFGDNVYGLENAALRFFSKKCAQLSLPESALLIGVLKGNSLYSPLLNPANALKRRNTVLEQMHVHGAISRHECESAQDAPLGLRYKGTSQYLKENGYFLQQVRQESTKIIEQYNAANGTAIDINTDGLTIRTTLDKAFQDVMLSAVNKHLRVLQKLLDAELRNDRFWSKNAGLLALADTAGAAAEKNMLLPYFESDTVRSMTRRDSLRYALSRLQSSVLAADPATGAVKVWIGGANYQLQPYDRVLSKRQVGSTFKPIVYYTALKDGLSPCKYFACEREVYSQYENWSPGNADSVYEGYFSVRGALAHSVNTVTAKVLFSTSIDQVVQTARAMGIASDLPEVPSIALGTASISLAEMVQAYCAFATVGYSAQLFMVESITDNKGTVLYQHPAQAPRMVLEKTSTEELIAMLQTAVNEGTGRRIREHYGIKAQIAGKTGTTQNNTDGWFIGFTHKLVMGVWTGLDNPAVHFVSTASGQGANTSLPIWAMGFKRIENSPLAKKYIGDFPFDYPEYLDCELYRTDKPGVFEHVFGKRPSETRWGAHRTQRRQKKAAEASDTSSAIPEGKKKFRLFRKRE